MWEETPIAQKIAVRKIGFNSMNDYILFRIESLEKYVG